MGRQGAGAKLRHNEKKRAICKEKHSEDLTHVCFCPKCRKLHKVKFFYTGTVNLPWKFCAKCIIDMNREEEHRKLTRIETRKRTSQLHQTM